MAHQDTTVIFVPGAFHEPNGFDGTIAHLHQAGYKTSKVYTPSVLCNGATPIPNFDADVAEIRRHITEATSQGQKVILVMHSYGGIPGSEALRGLDQAAVAQEQDVTDGRGVVHAVYLASFMLRVGESGLSVQRGEANWLSPQEDGSILPLDPAYRFGYDEFSSQAEIDRWVSEIRPWSIGAATSQLTYEPWRVLPTTYLTCEYDRAVPVDWQRDYIKFAIEAGAVDLRTVFWKCGHTPFGVDPAGVSKLIRRAVGDVVDVEGKKGAAGTIASVEAVEVHI